MRSHWTSRDDLSPEELYRQEEWPDLPRGETVVEAIERREELEWQREREIRAARETLARLCPPRPTSPPPPPANEILWRATDERLALEESDDRRFSLAVRNRIRESQTREAAAAEAVTPAAAKWLDDIRGHGNSAAREWLVAALARPTRWSDARIESHLREHFKVPDYPARFAGEAVTPC